MLCLKCKQEFPGRCLCEDRDERVATLRRCTGVVTRVCAICDKHADLCKCPDGPVTRLSVMPRGAT